jgi:hypothetical protein
VVVHGGQRRRPIVGDDLDDTGIAHDVGDVTLGHDPTVGHQNDPVGLLGLVHVVGGSEDGRPGVGTLSDLVPQPAAGQRRNPRGRLVEDQEIGVVLCRRLEGGLTLDAEGEPPDDEAFVPGVAGRLGAEQAGAELEVLPHRQVGIEAEVLRDPADPPALGPGGRLVEQRDVSGARRQDAEK